MNELETLRTAFVAFMDGLWWGLRDSVGALSMYEGYSNGFRQVGIEMAEKMGGSGPAAAARIAAEVFGAIGLEIELNGSEIIVRSCPLWNRILERGLEYAFYIEEICWKPLLGGIAEKTGTKGFVEGSLRLAHIADSKAEYKKRKAKAALDRGAITESEYEAQVSSIDDRLAEVSRVGRYRFE